MFGKLSVLVCSVTFIISLTAFVSPAAQAQEVCATPGTVAFFGLAEERGDIVPSVHRQLSGLGRMALRGNCAVEITCVSDESLGADYKKIRDRQCSAARSAMVQFERRSDVRSQIQKLFKMNKVGVGKGWAAGAVYVTLK